MVFAQADCYGRWQCYFSLSGYDALPDANILKPLFSSEPYVKQLFYLYFFLDASVDVTISVVFNSTFY